MTENEGTEPLVHPGEASMKIVSKARNAPGPHRGRYWVYYFQVDDFKVSPSSPPKPQQVHHQPLSDEVHDEGGDGRISLLKSQLESI